MQAHGITLSLTEVVTHGAMFFKSRRIVRRVGESPRQARIRKVLQVLEDWQPAVRTCSTRGAQPRLVVNRPRGSEDSKGVSQLLGEAVTLYVASKAFSIPASRWSIRSYKKGVRHDIDAMGPAGRVIAEAKGRFNGNNIKGAAGQIASKFGAARSFNRALGVIYCLRTSADDSRVPFAEDVVLVDPAGDEAFDEIELWRDILSHYASFFSYQGKSLVAARLDYLAELPDGALVSAVNERTAVLPLPADRRPGGDIYGRTTLAVAGERYVGTIWEAAPLLMPGGFSEEKGALFLGLSISTISQLATLGLREIARGELGSWRRLEGQRLYSRNTDGVLGVWGPLRELAEHE